MAQGNDPVAASSSNELPPTLTELLAPSSSKAPLPINTSTQSYLAHLTALPLSALLAEPARLSSEHKLLTADLTQLCHSQYTTFLSLHSASQSLDTSFSALSTSLDALLTTAIPALESQSKAFVAETREIQKDRRRASLVLEHQDKLLDILELPHLLMTCVQNGYYAEALDLAAHAAHLSKSHPTIPLLRSIDASAQAYVQSMMHHLLQQLRSPAKLPVLFKTISLLRRMEVLDEEELAVAFLHGRATYLEAQFSTVAGDERERLADPARWVRKWVEVFREGVYDVVTQYSTIFLPTSATASASTSPEISRSLRSHLTTFTHSFLAMLVSSLRNTLPLLPISDFSSLASLLTQLSYCGSSFSRIGLDFRGLLSPIFEDTVLNIISGSFEEAAASLQKSIGAARKARRRPSEWLIASDMVNEPPLPAPAPTRTGSLSLHTPPAHLTSYPPLAIFLNSILQSLNALRLLAPASLLPKLLAALDSSLLSMSTALLSYSLAAFKENRLSNGEESVRVVERRAVEAIAHVVWVQDGGLVTYLRTALGTGVYGVKGPELEGMMGKDGAKSDWKEKLSALDIEHKSWD
ncbi:hypothetical protein BOTBODRAFT_29548 [Botryobasidium botryosum FD-172 SS1]|uniref:Conserved oligomeric Golgi complex subunit 8 n=1 Tax=Botryobasidium botryosum (strain FD-172 SS1) TaxID=930990 RepID=A0A067MR42_BOTB1|nr:hypothetical protein BOTBODRAFT_29548 [Botryobasidium botryosum FD-172 SS1]